MLCSYTTIKRGINAIIHYILRFALIAVFRSLHFALPHIMGCSIQYVVHSLSFMVLFYKIKLLFFVVQSRKIFLFAAMIWRAALLIFFL